MFTRLSTQELDVALHPVESWSLVRGHKRSNGLDAILDIKVSGLSALGRFVSLQLEGCEARKNNFFLMCPKEMATHYQYVFHQLNVSALFIMAVFHWKARVLLGHSFVFVPNIH